MSTTDIPDVDVEHANSLVAEGAFLLDVREDDEWAAGHAPAANHVALSRLGAEYADALPTDRTIVAMCKVGGRSAQATAALRQAGYDVVNVTGGMKAWAAAGLPVVTDSGEPGVVV